MNAPGRAVAVCMLWRCRLACLLRRRRVSVLVGNTLSTPPLSGPRHPLHRRIECHHLGLHARCGPIFAQAPRAPALGSPPSRCRSNGGTLVPHTSAPGLGTPCRWTAGPASECSLAAATGATNPHTLPPARRELRCRPTGRTTAGPCPAHHAARARRGGGGPVAVCIARCRLTSTACVSSCARAEVTLCGVSSSRTEKVMAGGGLVNSALMPACFRAARAGSMPASMSSCAGAAILGATTGSEMEAG